MFGYRTWIRENKRKYKPPKRLRITINLRAKTPNFDHFFTLDAKTLDELREQIEKAYDTYFKRFAYIDIKRTTKTEDEWRALGRDIIKKVKAGKEIVLVQRWDDRKIQEVKARLEIHFTAPDDQKQFNRFVKRDEIEKLLSEKEERLLKAEELRKERLVLITFLRTRSAREAGLRAERLGLTYQRGIELAREFRTRGTAVFVEKGRKYEAEEERVREIERKLEEIDTGEITP